MIHSLPENSLNKYFTSFGKALLLAEKFEDSCRFILQNALILKSLQKMELDISDLFDKNSVKGKNLRKRTIGNIAKTSGDSIVKSGILSEFVIDKLILAIDSRNWLAHSALVETAYWLGQEKDKEKLHSAIDLLRENIYNICVGEYICGSIEIEMNDKIPFYHSDQQEYYAKEISEWVFDFKKQVKKSYNIFHKESFEKYSLKFKPKPPTSK